MRFASCVNVGGAPYLFEYLLRKARPKLRLTTIDLDTSRFPRAAEVLASLIVQADVERMNGTNVGRSECVVFSEVFEHLHIDVLGTIRTVASLMAPDGFLYLTTPNGLRASGVLRVLRGRTGPSVVGEWRKLKDIGHMGHVREYSLRELCEVLDHVGLRVESAFHRRRAGVGRSLRGVITAAAVGLLPQLGDDLVIAARR